MEDFGDRLTMLMRRAKLKNPDVGQVTRRDPTTVSKWRSGLQVPTDTEIAAIVELLHKRGVQTTVQELRHGRDGASQVRGTATTYGVGEVEFTTLTAKQRARVWLEGFLLDLAEHGAGEDFVTSARRFLLNPANYDAGFGGHAMDDNQKLRHMQALATAARETLKQQGLRMADATQVAANAGRGRTGKSKAR